MEDVDVWLLLGPEAADPYVTVRGGVTYDGAYRIANLLGATVERLEGD